MDTRRLRSCAIVGGLAVGIGACGQTREDTGPDREVAPASPGAAADSAAGLAGTSWQLVRFEGGDGTVLTPDDPSKYTLELAPGGRLTARIDCNRGTGTWRSSGPPMLELGPLALTRAMCPPGSLHDQVVRQLPYVRSYVVRDGRLFLSLMADGGIYEFAPVPIAEGRTTGAIRGTATYRERMALPPGAVLEATLEDVSTDDAPADIVGQVRVENPGNPPIRFAIPYDPALVDPARRYTVRARITLDGKPLFSTDRHYPVLGSDGAEEVELLLRRTARGNPPAMGPSLESTYWKLTHLEGHPLSGGHGSEPHLRFDAATRRVAGSGGCNRYGGGYRVEGERIELTRMVGTLMACAAGMETEKAFLDALGRVAAWRISGATLALLDGSGTELARFEGSSDSGGKP